MCFVKAGFSRNPLLQIGHTNGRRPEIEDKIFLKTPFY